MTLTNDQIANEREKFEKLFDEKFKEVYDKELPATQSAIRMHWRDGYLMRASECVKQHGIVDPEHPESKCQECGSRNPAWHAPNELWNLVTGHPAGLIVCPDCFDGMAKQKGIVIDCVVDRLDNILTYDENVCAKHSLTEEEATKAVEPYEGSFNGMKVVKSNDAITLLMEHGKEKV